MRRPFLLLSLVSVCAVTNVIAQTSPESGTLKAIDWDKNSITITVDGKDQVFPFTNDLRTPGAGNVPLKNRLAEFKPGTKIQFLTAVQNGKPELRAMRLDAGDPRAAPKFDSSQLKPLTVLGTEKYQSYEGGLYPGGKNERPASHEKAGLALAKQVRPLDAMGKPAANGKIVLLSVGMSNTTQAFSTFKRIADSDPDKNPELLIVDGAQGGMTAARIKDPEDQSSGTRFWEVVDQRLKAAGATREQVQAAWIKQADAGPTSGFPKYATTLQAELKQIVQKMHERFPNLRMIYLSGRTYGGFARTNLNPEPYAYESGFAVKWLIEEQLKGDKELNFDAKIGAVKAPWLSWGPYLWANGTTKNPDGLFYLESDFGTDGTHPSRDGQQKVAERLHTFFKTDSTAKPWFVQAK